MERSSCVLTLEDYATQLKNAGSRIIAGSERTFWLEAERFGLIRMPTFDTSPPQPTELRQAFRLGKAGVVSYLVEPTRRFPANAFLYLCRDPVYCLEKLPSAFRRNVRRGLDELKIAEVSGEELLEHGLAAYADTRMRIGLSDGTAACFRKRFSARLCCSNHVFLGAWKNGTLVGFLSITRVERWAEIEGCFSMNAHLSARPNDALMYSVLSKYLTTGECDLVSYGLSSVQLSDGEAGLHAFKMKVGFQAKPVRRVFAPHPLLRPFVSRVGLWGVSQCLRMRPGSRQLLKVRGIICDMLCAPNTEVSL